MKSLYSKSKLSVCCAALMLSLGTTGCSGFSSAFGGSGSSRLAAHPEDSGASSRAIASLKQAGDNAYEVGHYSQAVSYYAMVFNKMGHDEAYLTRYADSLRRAGDPARAAALLRGLATGGSAGSELLIVYAKSELQGGDAEAALDAAYAAVAAAPGDAEPLITLGLALDASGQSEVALGAYRTALVQGPENPARVLNNIGLTLARLGQTTEARENLENAARLEPENETLQRNLQLLARLESAPANNEAPALEPVIGYAEPEEPAAPRIDFAQSRQDIPVPLRSQRPADEPAALAEAQPAAEQEAEIEIEILAEAAPETASEKPSSTAPSTETARDALEADNTDTDNSTIAKAIPEAEAAQPPSGFAMQYEAGSNGDSIVFTLPAESGIQAYVMGAAIYLFLPEGETLSEEAVQQALSGSIASLESTEMSFGQRLKFNLHEGYRADLTESDASTDGSHEITISILPQGSQTSQLGAS